MRTPKKQGPVVMGVIDDGIAFAQQRFRKVASGQVRSRVEYWWLQDGVYQGQPLPFGRELDNAGIDALLTTCTHGGVIDEDELYRRAGLTDFRLPGHKSAAWRISHGAHVMDQACGYEQDDRNRPERPIVCVQLPIRVTADTSGAHLLPYVHLAMIYIVLRAKTIATRLRVKSLPVVVNLSYGFFAGPHDGTSPIEDMFEKLIALAAALGVTLRITLPAGNSYLSRTHVEAPKAMFVADPSGSRTLSLNWRVLPDCRTPSFLEIWLPYRPAATAAGPRLRVTITSPTGIPGMLTEGGATVEWGPPAHPYGQMNFVSRPAPTERGLFRVSLRATTHLNPTPAHPDAPAGDWIVTLEDVALAPGDVVDLWVQRDDTLYGFPLRGRQSYFDVKSYHRFDHEGRDNQKDDPACSVRLEGTINAIATGPSPVVMGGFMRREQAPAKYSSGGPISPTRGVPPPNSDGVTADAPSDDSLVLAGVLGAGSRSGSVVAVDGTSVAAPRTARFLAENLAAGGNGDRAAVQAHPVLPASANFPSWREGSGMIDFRPVVRVRRL
jgi:hypothetical protein